MSISDKIKKEASIIAAPFIRPEGEQYFGAREGLDFADPLDLVTSTAASAYRALDRGVRWPVIKTGMRVGDKLSGLIGKPIASQEEAESYLDKYDPGGSVKAAGYDMSFHESNDGHQMNMFVPEGNPVFKSGVHIQPHKGTSGVEPITAAEEIEHGRRYVAGIGVPYDSLTGNRMTEYLAKLSEEMKAKGTALKNVYKHEGVLEGTASIPSVASTALSYILPSSQSYKLGEVGVQSRPHADRDRIQDKKSYEDLKGSLGKYSNMGDLESDAVQISERENITFNEAILKLVPELEEVSTNEDAGGISDRFKKLYSAEVYMKGMSKNSIVNDIMDYWAR